MPMYKSEHDYIEFQRARERERDVSLAGLERIGSKRVFPRFE